MEQVTVNAFSPKENEYLTDLLNKIRKEIGTSHKVTPDTILRHYVIDHGVKIEAFLSHILGYLIRVPDISKAKSFGYEFGALSYQAKSQLVQDVLRPTQKFEAKKLKLFSEIRNKFAHVDIINTMDDLAAIGADTFKTLKNMFSEVADLNVRLELLITDIYKILHTILIEEIYLRARDQRNIERNQYVDSKIATILQGLPNSDELFREIVGLYKNWESSQVDEITTVKEAASQTPDGSDKIK